VFFKKTTERYVKVISGQFFPELTEERRQYGWVQRDSAISHAVRMFM
jgi:hypothetical protein